MVDTGGQAVEVVAAQLTAEAAEQKKPPTVQALVDADSNHPGRQSTTLGRSGSSLPGFPQGVLHGIFGLTVVDQDGQGDPEQSRRAVARERLKAGLARDGGLSGVSIHREDHDNKDGRRALSEDSQPSCRPFAARARRRIAWRWADPVRPVAGLRMGQRRSGGNLAQPLAATSINTFAPGHWRSEADKDGRPPPGSEPVRPAPVARVHRPSQLETRIRHAFLRGGGPRP
ncbi:MAG: hypothetical protein M3019_05435 [Candidatus Dormibacteraeota bacterium]|nr:hypothetical protein [Candidatus Dormibacteraeota bacterium]